MKLLVELEVLNAGKGIDSFPCECLQCKQIFFKKKREIMKVLNGCIGFSGDFCSSICVGLSRNKKENVICLNCNTSFLKEANQIKKHPNHFCSHSCNATFYNKKRVVSDEQKEKVRTTFKNKNPHWNFSDKNVKFCKTCNK